MTKTYRPVMSAEQISHILYLAKTEQPISQLSISIVARLAPFAAKIDADAIAPAYISKPPTAGLLESLGGSAFSDDMIGTPETIPNSSLSKEEQWALAYSKYKLSPAACTLVEIKMAQEHMYLNDLMSPEELASFESDTNTNTNTNQED